MHNDYFHKYFLYGGKRLRPIAAIMTYSGYGGKKDILRSSLTLEFFHNSTLVHDDMMDDDLERRNNPTYHVHMLAEFLKRFKEKQIKVIMINKILK